MKKLFLFFCLFLLVTLNSFAQGTLVIRLAVSGAQIAEKNATPGSTTANPGRLGARSDGNLILSDSTDSTNQEFFIVDLSMSPSVLTKVTDTAALKAKVDDANGADPAPTAMTPRAVDVDSDNHIIILTGDSDVSYLFHADPQTQPPTVSLVSGLDRPFASQGCLATSIGGTSTMAVLGVTAYIPLNDRFGSCVGDAIVKIDVHSPDGGKTAATSLIEADKLLAVVGGGQENLDMNDITVRPSKGTLIVIDSGRNTGQILSSDNILEIDPTTGNVSLLVAASDIKADLGATDIGYFGVDVGPTDVIYLTNGFGPRGIIAIANPGAGQGDATLFASQADIVNNSNVRNISGAAITSLFFINAGLAVSPKTGEVLFTEGNSDSIIGVRRE